MLTITRALARRVRSVFGRALGRPSRGASIPVLFRSTGTELAIAVQGVETAVEFRLPRSQPSESFAMPLEMLKRCEGTREEPVSLEHQEGAVIVRWSDGGVPQSATCEAAPAFEPPPRPERMAVNEPRLIAALRDAADTTDAQCTRYALACVQLRGSDGRIAASDARQLLLQDGFDFPWPEELLVSGCAVFASRDLHSGEPVSIGRTDAWVTLTTGPWTVHLRIAADARFPDVDSIVPDADSARSILSLDPADAELLVGALPRLPGAAERESPVTVELNGRVAIRSRGEDDPKAAELLLANSRAAGAPVVCQTNRELLARAVRLRFREVRFFEPGSTVLCRDERRRFVWMPLNAGPAVPAEADPVGVESPTLPAKPAAADTSGSRIRRRRSRTPTETAEAPSKPVRAAVHTNGRSPVEGPTVIARLLALREELKSAVAQTNEAIRALKRQQRDDRLLQATLASLRQLRSLGA